MPADTITYRRTELYEQVWAEPVRTVAKRYGVSDVALGKVCGKLRVPVPGLGHWARVRVGQVVRQIPLPPLPDGAPSEIVHERWRPPADRPAIPKANAEPPIVVPQELRSPHKLVSQTSRIIRGVRSPTDQRLDISVSKESRGRALRIMNALLRALERKGLEVEVTRTLSYEERQAKERLGEEVFSGATRVRVDGEWIRFGIDEKSSVVHTPAPEPPNHLRGKERDAWIWRNPARRDLVPNGTLELSIKSSTWPTVRSLWHDGKKKRVEDCLSDFVAHLYVTAEALKRRRIDLERARIERQEEEYRQFEAQQRQREEERQAKAIEEKLGRWRLAQDARAYADEVRRLLAESGREVESGSPLEQSLARLEAYIARTDPLSALREAAVGPGGEPAAEDAE